MRIPMAIVGLSALAIIYLALVVSARSHRTPFSCRRGVWVAAVQSVTLTNTEALDNAVAGARNLSGGVGEGLLDSFDMGPGF